MGPFSHNLPPLLPRPSNEAREEPQPSRPLPPRRPTVIAACEGCRQRKSRCDGTRPRCLACIRIGRDCIYRTNPSETAGAALKRTNSVLRENIEELRKSHSELQMLIQALQTRDEVDAVAIFKRLREGADIEGITRHLHAGDLLLQIHLAPETRFRYEFPYRRQMPRALLTPDNPYLRSVIYEATFLPADRDDEGLQSPYSSRERDFKSPYSKPYMAADIVDSRLDTIKPSQWTNVSNNDQFLRRILKLYFLYEYHFFSPFQKDVFLDDMLSGSTNFCSSLLVNVILAVSCNCCNTLNDRGQFWNPHTVGYKFLAEARRLWELELLGPCTVTSIQAAVMMNVMYNMYAMDKVGMPYSYQAVSWAKDLMLFDDPAQWRTERERRGYGITAWSLYFWVSVKCYHLCLPPILLDPPKTPLADADLNPIWYSESWVRYPLDDTLYPLNHPHFFKTKCHLATIMNNVGADLFQPGQTIVQGLPQEKLTNHLSHMTNWYATLPAALSPAEIVYPFQFDLHTLYQLSVLNLSEISIETPDAPMSVSQNPEMQGALEHARQRFETIMRLYYLRHGFAVPDGHMSHTLVLLAYQGVSMRRRLSPPTSSLTTLTVQQEEAMSTMILATKGLHDQGANYYLPLALLRVLQHEMLPEERDVLSQYISHNDEEDGETKLHRETYMRSEYPMGSNVLTRLSREKKLDDLQHGFTTLAKKKAQTPSSSFMSASNR